MAWVEARVVRTFRFGFPDNLVDKLMLQGEDIPLRGEDPEVDAAYDIASKAFQKWAASEDAKAPFTFDEIADCVLGSDVLPGFVKVGENDLHDGTPIF